MADILERRRRVLGTGPRLYYDVPFQPVRGSGTYLYDVRGDRYLDAYNNVPHVGHCHPRVTEAIREQCELLNTNTRYLFDSVLDYAECLVGTMDPGLDTVLFTCTGSEANDLAGRIARTVTGNDGVLTTSGSYHGNTIFLRSIDPSGGSSSSGSPSWWTTVEPPVGGNTEDPAAYDLSAEAYGSEIDRALRTLAERGHRPSCFFFDTYFCADGVYPTKPGYMRKAVDAFRVAGGFIVADEVQPGLGRNGSYFWGYQRLGINPDIVTSGKPLGNGHPIGVVVTRRDIAEAFFEVDRYFNTFAGNPVSSVAGLAVLKVLHEERLQDNARSVGASLVSEFERLRGRHVNIGAVRGEGYLIGVELLARDGHDSAVSDARTVINEACRRKVLIGTTGPNRYRRNILKIRPPMAFKTENVDELIGTIDDVLTDLSDGNL